MVFLSNTVRSLSYKIKHLQVTVVVICHYIKAFELNELLCNGPFSPSINTTRFPERQKCNECLPAKPNKHHSQRHQQQRLTFR